MQRSSEATTADIREDEEQAVKYQEIIDLLVAAGYFRARIKGLSNFDKVVGGLTWCIESCNYDVDIDLLFHENLTIGQKIALTEKIVVALPKMNCPHRIEPHQIQGLDCIHILPVVQWLVIQSMKNREEMAELARAYAISQANKYFKIKDSTSEETETNKLPEVFHNAHLPSRQYKRQGAVPVELETQLKSTLLEYGNIPSYLTSIAKETNKLSKEVVAVDTKQENQQNDLMKTMEVIDDKLSSTIAAKVGNIVNIQAEIAKVAENFANLQVVKKQDENNESKAIVIYEKRKNYLNEKLKNIIEEKQDVQEKLSQMNEKLSNIRTNRNNVEEAFQKMREMETNENKGILHRLKEMLSIYDGLKQQELRFREQCKHELSYFQKQSAEMEKSDLEKEEEINEYDAQKKIVSKLRLQLAKKNRQVAIAARQLDDVPCRSEVSQYRKRFLELYNQISAKHGETKQYYSLYNTLYVTKQYLNKELSILNSIQENHKEATLSSKEFFNQLCEIIDGVENNKKMVERKLKEIQSKKDGVVEKLTVLKTIRLMYLKTVEELRKQCRVNELILANLRQFESHNN